MMSALRGWWSFCPSERPETSQAAHPGPPAHSESHLTSKQASKQSSRQASCPATPRHLRILFFASSPLPAGCLCLSGRRSACLHSVLGATRHLSRASSSFSPSASSLWMLYLLSISSLSLHRRLELSYARLCCPDLLYSSPSPCQTRNPASSGESSASPATSRGSLPPTSSR